MDAFGKLGTEGYLNQWIANQDSTDFDGVEATPWRAVQERGGLYLRDFVKKTKESNKKLGVVLSHAALMEPMITAAINTTRDTPVKNLGEMGGAFSEEDYAILNVDGDHAVLDRNGQKYNIDLTKLGVAA